MRPFNRFLAAIPVAALLVAMFAVPAFADPRDFSVTNNTSFIVTNVYAGTSDSDTWGDDILGRDVLAPSEAVNVTLVPTFCGDGTSDVGGGDDAQPVSVTTSEP